MTNYQLAKLMKIERACVKRGNSCDRKCAKCDLVQEDSTLIAAYDQVIKMLEDPQLRHVVLCCQCEYWDQESGLSARECNKHDRFTTRYGYCSDGREIHYDP